MRSLATLEKRIGALEATVANEPVGLRQVQLVNLLGSSEAEPAVTQLVAYLVALHHDGHCPSQCRCEVGNTGQRLCAVRSPVLPVLIYASQAGLLAAECALGTFETNYPVPDARRAAHGSII